jgi:hypothetical protein
MIGCWHWSLLHLLEAKAFIGKGATVEFSCLDIAYLVFCLG